MTFKELLKRIRFDILWSVVNLTMIIVGFYDDTPISICLFSVFLGFSIMKIYEKTYYYAYEGDNEKITRHWGGI